MLAMRTVTSLMRIVNIKLVYFVYFHSIMSHRIILGGNSMDSKKEFYIQETIIKMTGAKKKKVL
jgi:hypothetical protein